MSEILNALSDAFLWFLEGVLGSLSAAVYAHTDVPWYQCLISSLILAAFGFLSEVAVSRWRKAIRRKKEAKNRAFHD